MKVFGVVGVSTSGKTTLVVNLVKELVSRGYTVGTVKSIGCGRSCSVSKPGKYYKGCSHSEHGFTIDTKGKNSFKHREAGASMTATWAEDETAVIVPKKLTFEELAANYDYDFLIVEGYKSSNFPKIVTGITPEDTKRILNKNTFAVSGKIADSENEIEGIKTFKTEEDIVELTDLAIKSAKPLGEYSGVTVELNENVIDTGSIERELRNLLLKMGLDESKEINIKIMTN